MARWTSSMTKKRRCFERCECVEDHSRLMLTGSSAEAGGLNKIARLDTTVTVLDGFRFFEEFETIQLLHERFTSEVETPEDERTVSDLMIDQIEFADVIIVNKVNIHNAVACNLIYIH